MAVGRAFLEKHFYQRLNEDRETKQTSAKLGETRMVIKICSVIGSHQ